MEPALGCLQSTKLLVNSKLLVSGLPMFVPKWLDRPVIRTSIRLICPSIADSSTRLHQVIVHKRSIFGAVSSLIRNEILIRQWKLQFKSIHIRESYSRTILTKMSSCHLWRTHTRCCCNKIPARTRFKFYFTQKIEKNTGLIWNQQMISFNFK